MNKEQRRERTARWREFCQDQATEGAGRLFKWVRTGTAVFGLPSCPPSYEAEEGCPAPGQQSRIAAVDKAWWKFWGTADAGAEDFGDWVGPRSVSGIVKVSLVVFNDDKKIDALGDADINSVLLEQLDCVA